MADQNWRDRISSNKTKLSQLTNLSPVFLDMCLERNVLSRDEKDAIVNTHLDYDKKSKFYDIVLIKDHHRFKIMTHIMRERETRQSDDVLIILEPSNLSDIWKSPPGSSKEIQNKSHQFTSMTLSSPSRRYPVWFDVVQPLVDVVGRDETLVELHKLVTRNAGNENNVAITSQLTCVCGLGGIGKSTLVRKYACECTEFFDGNVIWIKANNEQQIQNSIQKLASCEEVNIVLKDWNIGDANMITIFKFFSHRKSLFIFDDVENYVGIVDKFLPLNLGQNINKPYILMTSRKESLDLKIKDFKLGVPGIEHIAKLMTTKLEMENVEDKKLAYKLAVQLKGLPLAAQQAISYIQKLQKRRKRFAKQENPFEEYLTLLQDSSKGRTLLDFGVADDYGKTVFQTWNTTMTTISETEEYGRSAERIMNILAYFNYDCIKCGILETIEAKETIEESLTLLAEYSMLEVNEGFISIHPLVQQVIRFKNKSIEPKLLAECLFILRNRSDSLEHSHTIWKSALQFDELIQKFPTVGIRLCENVHLGSIDSDNIFQETSNKFNQVFGLNDMHTLELDCIRIISLCHDVNEPDYALISRLNLMSRLNSCSENHVFQIVPVLSRLAGSLLKVGKSQLCPRVEQEKIILSSLQHYEKIRQFEQAKLNVSSITETKTHDLIMECREILSEIAERSLPRRIDKTTELRRALEEGIVTNLIGASGVGKTTLVLKYIEEFAEYYEDVIWINASTKESMEMSLLKTAAQLGIQLHPEADGSWWSLNAQFTDLMNIIEGKSYLFVFLKLGRLSYNVPYHCLDSYDFFGYLDFSKSGPDHIHVLYLSTERIIHSNVENFVHLDIFKQKEAIEFICNSTNSADRKSAGRLAKRLHHFPLALHYAIKYISHHNTDSNSSEPIESKFSPIRQYLELYEEHSTKIHGFNSQSAKIKRSKKHSAEPKRSEKLKDTVEIVWNITKYKIQTVTHGMDAIKVLKIMSYLDPDELSFDLIHSIVPECNSNECLKILKEYGVVGERNCNIHIHSLLQKIIQKKNRSDQRETELLIVKNANFELYNGKAQLIFLFNEVSRREYYGLDHCFKEDTPILQEIVAKIGQVFGPIHKYTIKTIREGIISLNHPYYYCPDPTLLLSLCQQIIQKLNECSSIELASFSEDGIRKLLLTLPFKFKIEDYVMSKEFVEIELQLYMAQFEFHKRIEYRQIICRSPNYIEGLFKCLQKMKHIEDILTVSRDIENFVLVKENVTAKSQITDLAKYLLEIGRDGTTIEYDSLICESLEIIERLEKFIQDNNHVSADVNSLEIIQVKVACLLLTQQNEKILHIVDPLFKIKIRNYTKSYELTILTNILKEMESFGQREFELYSQIFRIHETNIKLL